MDGVIATSAQHRLEERACAFFRRFLWVANCCSRQILQVWKKQVLVGNFSFLSNVAAGVKNNFVKITPLSSRREKLKFQEKTVTSLSGNSNEDSNVGFKKKRKFGGNVRKRDTTA